MISRIRLLALVGLAAVAATAALASCSLTTSLDGLTPEGLPSSDAGDASPTLDGDEPPTDGSSGGEAGADGGPELAFCVREPGHLFCSDWESGSVLDGKWEGTAILPGSTMTREVIAPASGRGNIVSTTPAASSGEVHAVLVKNYTQPVKSMTVAASVKLGTCVPTGSGLASMLSVSAGPSNNIWVAAILVTPSGVVMNATKCQGDGGASPVCTSSNNTLTAAPTLNAWSRVVMTVDHVASTVTVTVDGKLALDKKPVTLTTENTSALLNIGLFAQAPVGACRVEYDDVTFDIQ
jgi:hypothetical protein